ncbi:hypothetical protein MTR67_022610 [Solanum verrucosum]|uniref:Uncharacterized protein n=1 Tax=Solanum verrucosum TaxID=315347 RepID=A0AAF0QUZ4_SOLVR|nr:hypothetical protein MTR67_022610 [Solanum verrucosum]
MEISDFWCYMWHSRTPSTDRRWTHGPSCRSVVTDRSLCTWIDAPKAQLQSQTTVDQHGPSFDPRSVGLTVDRRFRFSASRSRLDRFPIFSSAESVVPLVPDQEVSNAEFRNANSAFGSGMTNENNQQVPVPTNRNDGSVTARV